MLDQFTCNCLNVIIATEFTKGPYSQKELATLTAATHTATTTTTTTDDNDDDEHQRASGDTIDLQAGGHPADVAQLPFAPIGVIYAKLGIGGIKIEHKYLTSTINVNSLQVTMCCICRIYTHAVKSSDSPFVFISSNLRKSSASPTATSNPVSNNIYENIDLLCPLKVLLTSAVKPNAFYAGKSAHELHRMLFPNNNMKKQANAIDELITRACRLNDEAQKQCENEIRLFSEKAHERYKAKQLATNASMDILAQLIASMDDISEESGAEKAQATAEKATESDAINSLGLGMEEQRKALRGVPEPGQTGDERRASLSANTNGTSNNANVPDDVLGDMEFNADDDLPLQAVNGSSKSPSENEAGENENDDTDDSSESDDLPIEELPSQGNRQVSQEVRMRGRRGSINSPGDGRVPILSRSVPIDVPCDKRATSLSVYTFSNCP